MVEYLTNTIGLSGTLAWTIAAVVAAVLVLNVIAGGALVFIWAERKVAARIQDRLGPTRTGGRFGWLQSLADGIKLLAKEDLMPDGADGMLFRIAPYVSFCASFCAFIALPFAFDIVGLRLNVAVFFVVAVLGLEVFGVIIAGYASASKWSLFGAMREAAQVVSYEVPLGMCVVVPVMLAGSMDMVTIAEKQAGWFWNWYLFHDPFTFIVFWVYVTCAVASVNRAPFDLAEAESELVAGFHTEYSGLRWSYFFMAEYGSMFLVSAMAAVLFLGGWNGPIPVAVLLGLSDGTGDTAPVSRPAPGAGQPGGQGELRRPDHDVDPLDAPPVADRSGDDDLPQVLHADRRRDVRRGDALAAVSARGALARRGPARR